MFEETREKQDISLHVIQEEVKEEFRMLTQVANELLGVVVNESTLLDGSLNGRKVRVCQNHVCSQFRNIGTASHSHSDVCLLQCRCIVDTITGLPRKISNHKREEDLQKDTNHSNNKSKSL